MSTPLALPPALLLDNETIILDSTSTENFKLCPRKFQHEQIDRRIRSGAKPALEFGKALHSALEIRYKRVGNQPAVGLTTMEMQTAVDNALEGIEMPLDEWRTLGRANETVELYNAYWGAEPFDVLGVEIPFAVPVGTVGRYKVVWSGRIDLLVQWEDCAYIMDHKTMSSWGSGKSAEFSNSAQFRGYAWAIQELHRLHGAPFPARIAGFCLNALVLRKPGTTARTTLPRTVFHRDRVFYSQERLDEWRTDLLVWVRTLIGYAEDGYMPMNTKHCANFYGGNCPLLDVCTAPPAQRAMALSSDLYENNEWSPLNHAAPATEDVA